MQLDPTTLIFLNVANLLAMSMALPLVMGQNLSAGAHHARLSLMVNASAWLALIFAGFWREQWPDWLLSTLAMALLSLCNCLIFRALSHWLGPRPLGRLLWVLVIATPIGYALSFQNYAVRVGWANLLIAAQLLILARATLWPRNEFGRGAWREPTDDLHPPRVQGVVPRLAEPFRRHRADRNPQIHVQAVDATESLGRDADHGEVLSRDVERPP